MTNAATQTEVPGPDADRKELLVWYRDVVQGYFATHTYDDFIVRCHWCLTDDQQVRERGTRGGSFKFCSDRCADASQAYYTKVLGAASRVYQPGEQTKEQVDPVTAEASSDEGLSDIVKELKAAAVAARGRFSIQSLADSAHKDWYAVRDAMQANPEIFRPVNSRKWELVA